MIATKTSWRDRVKQVWGTPRRLIWNVFRPGYVRENLAERTGECRRCGACCRLVVKCVFFFHDDDGLPACRAYGAFRFPNCTKFPIDHRDIADRDRIAPHEPCGYSWTEASAAGSN